MKKILTIIELSRIYITRNFFEGGWGLHLMADSPNFSLFFWKVFLPHNMLFFAT